MDKVNIKLKVGVWQHPLSIDAADEPLYREAARLIDERLVAYSTKYRAAQLDRECVMSLVALDIAFKYLRQRRDTDVEPVEKALKALTDELEDFNQSR